MSARKFARRCSNRTTGSVVQPGCVYNPSHDLFEVEMTAACAEIGVERERANRVYPHSLRL
jgi:hypothetical protein